MNTEEKIKGELMKLLEGTTDLINLAGDDKDASTFGSKYQHWYSRAIKFVETLAPDRLQEFSGYYLIDPKRQVTDEGNYVIQDYFKGVVAKRDDNGKVLWDHNTLIKTRITNQLQILGSLSTRIDAFCKV